MFKQENKSKSYYDILKIYPDSSDADIRKSYLELAQIYHPDKNPGNKKIAALRFRLINEAYAALKTPDGRARYNRLLLSQRGQPKGINLKADNDNRSVSNDTGLWDSFVEFFMPPKTAPQKHNSGKE
ncbi:MAG: hypothetical protein COB36_01660 [Alphaproteobacteria bacterium]|nr:MAG: hypothetical protein COB36_01660 [Alphaproteobacteria bacterium]